MLAGRAFRGRAGTFLGHAVPFRGHAVAFCCTRPILSGSLTIARTLTSVMGCPIVPGDRAFLGRAGTSLSHPVAPLRRALPLVGRALPLIGHAVTLVGHAVTLVSQTVAPLRRAASLVSCLLLLADRAFPGRTVTFLARAIALLGRPLTLIGRSVAFLRRALTIVGRALPFRGRTVAFRGRLVPFPCRAVPFLGLLSVLCRSLTITPTLTSVSSCLLVLADRVFRGRAVTLIARAVAFLSRAVAFGRRTVAFGGRTAVPVDRTVASVDGQAFLRRVCRSAATTARHRLVAAIEGSRSTPRSFQLELTTEDTKS